MATVTAHIKAPPEAIFAVLADGWSYSGWVVGTSHMRAVEDTWPSVGSRLFHASGVWPAVLADETSVEAVTRDERLVMTARGRPFGEARIEVSLSADGDGTSVTLAETPISGPGHWLHNRVSDSVLHRRNEESLARLAAMSERRTTPSR